MFETVLRSRLQSAWVQKSSCAVARWASFDSYVASTAVRSSAAMCTCEKGHSYEYGLSSAAAGTCSRTSPEPSFVSKCLSSAEYAATARDNARAGLERS